MALLKKEYGDEIKISQTYLRELEDWPRVPYENGAALKDFKLHLEKCFNLMETMHHMNQLNSTRELELIAGKLPSDLQRSWRDRVHTLMSTGTMVQFKHFVQFVSLKSDILNMS